MTGPEQPRQRLLTFASGGWVILLTAVVAIALVAWAVAPAIKRSSVRPLGDGKTLESYAFDHSNLIIPREEIRTDVMLHRDMVPVMFEPTASGPTSSDVNDPDRWTFMQKRNDLKYGKYLVPDDRVIGVTINGESRCYPISVMNVHEIVNDTLGETPIAVTYHWPCDSAMVFDRRVDGRAREFAISGLIYNCNMLMYERSSVIGEGGHRAAGGEGLWSQLLATAVCGADSGKELTIISSSLTTWREWATAHPQTTVLDRDQSIANRYKDASPVQYFQDDKPLRPVNPSPPADSMPNKTRCVIVEVAGTRYVFPHPALAFNADKDGAWSKDIGGVSLHFRINRATQTVLVTCEPPNASFRVMHSLWFAWHAMHPGSTVVVR